MKNLIVKTLRTFAMNLFALGLASSGLLAVTCKDKVRLITQTQWKARIENFPNTRSMSELLQITKDVLASQHPELFIMLMNRLENVHFEHRFDLDRRAEGLEAFQLLVAHAERMAPLEVANGLRLMRNHLSDFYFASMRKADSVGEASEFHSLMVAVDTASTPFFQSLPHIERLRDGVETESQE